MIPRELYDGIRDPNEMHNSVDSPTFAAEQAEAAGLVRQ
jgi:hypothetical protein